MKKTINLLKKYLQLFEQDEVTAEQPAPAPAKEPIDQPPTVSEGEREVIKILVAAFLFNPSLFKEGEREAIDKEINRIKNSVNVPIPATIDNIKRIISRDKNLKLERTVLTLIDNYLKIVEQSLDATEPNSEISSPNENNTTATQSEQADKLQLQEIFPLYKDLIIRALYHSPTTEDLALKIVVDQNIDTDPEKIVDFITTILNQSAAEEDRLLKNNLSNV